MAIIDYNGFRLMAVSLLPIDKNSIVYGSSDAGKTVHATRQEFNQSMSDAAAALNLKVISKVVESIYETLH